MPNIPCPNKITCDCTDDPVTNFSSEALDVDRTPALIDIAIDPPLGTIFDAVNCTGVCFSTISQEDADDCAYAQAQICIFEGWRILLPDASLPTAFPYYGNQAVTCTIKCSDGTRCGVGECVGVPTFSWTIAANTVYGTNQAQANLQAGSTACNRARKHAICFVSAGIPPACIDTAYRFQIVARGGTPWTFPYGAGSPSCSSDPDHVAFSDIPYNWQIISGSLPSGLELSSCSGIITGTPTGSGSFPFTVLITDAIGSYQTKAYTMCVVEITTASPLPDATLDTLYNQNLAQTPADQESEIWSIVDGELPEGLDLTDAGILTGTPTESGDFTFTAGVSVSCPATRGGICEREFTLAVAGAPEPDLWWDYEDDTSMLDVVQGVEMTCLVLNDAPGIVGLGFEWVPSVNAIMILDTGGGIGELAYTAGDDFSMAGWFKWTGVPDANDAFQLMRFFGDANNQVFLWFVPVLGVPNLRLEVDNGTDSDVVFLPLPTDTDFHHYVLVYDAATGLASVYIDTVLSLSTTIPVALLSETAGRVGHWQLGGGGGSSVGQVVDEFGMWLDVKLSQSAIDFLFNSGNGRTFPYS